MQSFLSNVYSFNVVLSIVETTNLISNILPNRYISINLHWLGDGKGSDL